MEQDTRIGLALGILLIGIVGALFFRNERTGDDLPQMMHADELDAQIAERDLKPYASSRSANSTDPHWKVPDFLKQEPDPGPVALPGPIPAEGSHPPTVSTNPSAAGSVTSVDPSPAPGPQTAQQSPPSNVQTREYLVKSGDTLSGIAEEFLGAGSKFMEIYELNRDRLRSPDAVRTGMRLRVPKVRH